MQYIAFDSHKHYTWVRVEDEAGQKREEARIDHERSRSMAILGHSRSCLPGHPVQSSSRLTLKLSKAIDAASLADWIPTNPA